MIERLLAFRMCVLPITCRWSSERCCVPTRLQIGFYLFITTLSSLSGYFICVFYFSHFNLFMYLFN